MLVFNCLNCIISSSFPSLPPSLPPSLQDELQNTLTYNQPKRVLFDSSVGQGVVYNVLAIDVVNGTMSAYVPGSEVIV